jgi:hypothetical protein
MSFAKNPHLPVVAVELLKTRHHRAVIGEFSRAIVLKQLFEVLLHKTQIKLQNLQVLFECSKKQKNCLEETIRLFIQSQWQQQGSVRMTQSTCKIIGC